MLLDLYSLVYANEGAAVVSAPKARRRRAAPPAGFYRSPPEARPNREIFTDARELVVDQLLAPARLTAIAAEAERLARWERAQREDEEIFLLLLEAAA